MFIETGGRFSNGAVGATSCRPPTLVEVAARMSSECRRHEMFIETGVNSQSELRRSEMCLSLRIVLLPETINIPSFGAQISRLSSNYKHSAPSELRLLARSLLQTFRSYGAWRLCSESRTRNRRPETRNHLSTRKQKPETRNLRVNARGYAAHAPGDARAGLALESYPGG